MCFSAPVSFAASGVLGATGAACIYNVKSKRELPLAMVPLFFGVQQLIEGFIWLGVGTSSISQIFVYGFLFFAYLIWPIYIPIAVMLVEDSKSHKSMIKIVAVIGLFVSLYLLLVTLLFHKVGIQVIGCHIGHPYAGDMWYAAILPFYLAAVGVAPLLSSNKILQIFGISIIVSCIVTLVVALTWFTSMWCFAAAILSLIIYWFFVKKPKVRS